MPNAFRSVVTPIISIRSRLCRMLRTCGLVFALQACANRSHVPRSDVTPAVNSSSGGAATCDHDGAGAGSFDSSAPNQWPGPGVLHLTDAADAINVSFDADGSVRQLTFGCDFSSCSSG